MNQPDLFSDPVLDPERRMAGRTTQREQASACPASAGPRPVLTAEQRASYLEQILRDEQTIRLGLDRGNEAFYRERIAAYKADL